MIITNIYKALEKQKEALQKAYVGFSDLLKGPAGDNDQSPKHKYHLCGVATKPGVTYVLHNDSSNAAREETASANLRQWWRMEYTSEPKVIKQVSDRRLLDIEIGELLRKGDNRSKLYRKLAKVTYWRQRSQRADGPCWFMRNRVYFL